MPEGLLAEIRHSVASHKLLIRDYLAAIALFVNAVKGISSLQLARYLGISAKAAWVLAHKLREAMAAEVKSMTIGGHGEVVEVDGCYVGGTVRQANPIYSPGNNVRRVLNQRCA